MIKHKVKEQIVKKSVTTEHSIFLSRSSAIGRAVLMSFPWIFAFSLVGCQSMPSQQSAMLDVQATEVAEPEVAKLNGSQMYEIMVAELLLQRQQSMPAFQLIYELAENLQSAELAERAFQISMQTYDAKAILLATHLWKSLDSQAELAWKSSFLLAARRGDTDTALEDWEQYQSLSKETLEQDLLTAAIRTAQSASAESGLAFLQALAKRYSNQAGIQYGLGVAAKHYQLPELALRELKKAQAIYTQRVTQADASGSLGATEQAEAIRDQKLYQDTHYQLLELYLAAEETKLQEGIELLAPYAQQVPEDLFFQENYARLEVRVQRYGQAQARYRDLLQRDPNKTTARFSLALLDLDAGNYAAADPSLVLLLDQPKFKAPALYYLGVSKKEQSAFSEAKAYLLQVEQGHYWLDAQIRLAELDFLMDDWPAGETRLSESITRIDSSLMPVKEQNQKLGKLYRAKGALLQQANQFERAVDNYKIGLQRLPNQINLLLGQAMALYELTRFTEYEVNLKRVLELDDQHVEALNALGYFYAEQGKHLVEAERLLNQALALAPNEAYILDSVGWLAYQKQDYVQAEKYLEKAFALQEDAEVLYHLLQVKLKLNKISDVKRLWHKYADAFAEEPQFAKLAALVEAL